MKSTISIKGLCFILGLLIMSTALAKPKVRPYSQRVNGDRYVGVKLTWTFLVESKSKKVDSLSAATPDKKVSKEFPSLEAALSDPSVSAADKSLIKNTYIPKLARFNSELKKLNLDAAKKQPNGKPLFDSATIHKRFNALLDQHASGLSIQKIAPQALAE